mmetsp:Transcript_11486/g.14896  ORF Transcript_11486/g.14896 Transcript_11486/m.14896 type:complete len:768 (+) Transcript_11486:69-2372(+)
MVSSEATAQIVVNLCAVIGICFGAYQFWLISKVKLPRSSGSKGDGMKQSLRDNIDGGRPRTRSRTQSIDDLQYRLGGASTSDKLVMIYTAISDGASAFLAAEYTICAIFVALFSILVFFLTWMGEDPVAAALTTCAFILGSLTSIACGLIGMKVAVFSNVRTTLAATEEGWTKCFNVAFRAGGVMGYCLCGLGILVLSILVALFRVQYSSTNDWALMMECISGYGLGGSSIALFGRVGGGIYTKAADVGADLVGKVVHGIPEDDPRNPATIADNVGDNVGDVAGMGADLFGSFAEATCAALVLSASCQDLLDAGFTAVVFPIAISAVGILVCMATSFVATHITKVKKESDVESVLKWQLIITTFHILWTILLVAYFFLPNSFTVNGITATITVYWYEAWLCVISGTVGGLIIGLITEYYTSNTYAPVIEVARSCKTGAATNVIYGLALGYKSCIIPTFVLAFIVCMCMKLADLYGVSLAAVGMLSTLATGLTIDAYGPVCDNAGGIAEMSELDHAVRDKTDALDAAGNTTAAVGKGFAIGSAALVSLALFGAFVTRLGITDGIDIFEPVIFAFLLIGAMLPYWFSAMTMKSVGHAAMEMVMEVERQFNEQPDLLNEGSSLRPDYERCVEISTKSSLRYMIAPGALVMLSPLVAGTLFGVYAVCGLLTGGLISGVQMAVSMSNTGGAWDNAKKLIEQAGPEKYPELEGKGSDIHKAGVIGDTVGDPLKDTSGPSLNILMKLMAILSLVFASYFHQINDGNGLITLSSL